MQTWNLSKFAYYITTELPCSTVIQENPCPSDEPKETMFTPFQR